MARILIVDDSGLARNTLKTILKNGEHQVVGEATDGEQAISQYDRLKPDIVTMDITMPNINGIESLKRIMADDPQARVIMISALGQGGKVLEALNNGARHYITKPFEPEKVLEAISDVMTA
jgi:two-component system chemotaxis response regulator CheY